MNATWKNTDERSESGWNVVHCFKRAPGFGAGVLLELGFDNTKPAEMRGTCERRIADRFDCVVGDLVLEVI